MEEVKEFVHLDSRVAEDGRNEEDINKKLVRTNQTSKPAQCMEIQNKLSKQKKIRIF